MFRVESGATAVAHRRGLMGRRRFAMLAATAVLAVVAPWSLVAGCTAKSVADSTSELQARFDALPPGGSITLDPVTYPHSGVLVIRVPGVRIDGNGATLQATNDSTSAVKLAADNIALSNVTLAAPREGQRFSGLDQHKLVVTGNGVSVSGVNVDGSAAAGVFVFGARDFRIDNVSISGTRADGLHMTHGAAGGSVSNVRTNQTGDDGIAVVSYQNDPAPTTDIRISGVDVAGTTWGRGLTVVGGRNIAVQGFSVANTSSAGVYVASEGAPYFTRSVEAVSIADGSVTNANTNPGVIQGGVLVTAQNPGSPVRDVQISNVTVSNTPASAQKDVGIVADGAPVEGVRLDNVRINGSTVEPLYTNIPGGSFQTSGWTLDGQPISVG